MRRKLVLTALLVCGLVSLIGGVARAEGDGEQITVTIVGRIVDTHGEPVSGVKLKAWFSHDDGNTAISQAEVTTTASDGHFFYHLELEPSVLEDSTLSHETLHLQVSKPTYQSLSETIDDLELVGGNGQYYLESPDLELPHAVNAAFFIATFTFILVFALIAFRVFHETIAALFGAGIILGVSLLVGLHRPDFYIFSFERAIHYIDFEVLFLVMGMMIFVAIMGQTGLFQWTAFAAYRLTKGRAVRLAIFLMVVTAILSALLDNVTTILLVAPITIQIALLLDIHPFSLLVPEIFAANIGGAATLVGDPPNIIIGSFANLGFLSFLLNMGPLALVMMIVMIALMTRMYREDYSKAQTATSPELLLRLEQDTRIKEPALLRKALVVFGGTLILFLLGEALHLPPSVSAFMGATILLAWVRPDLHELIREVDWTTLVFFMGLFMVVGGIQEVGLIQMVADLVKGLTGANLLLAMVLLIWLSGLASAIVDNVPFTAAVLPIAAYLTKTIPGAQNNVLYWAISAGACFGGNATTLGSACNIVARGIASRAGYRLTFGRYLRVAGPTTILVLILTTLWFLLRY